MRSRVKADEDRKKPSAKTKYDFFFISFFCVSSTTSKGIQFLSLGLDFGMTVVVSLSPFGFNERRGRRRRTVAIFTTLSGGRDVLWMGSS